MTLTVKLGKSGELYC